MHIDTHNIHILVGKIAHTLADHFSFPEEHAWWILEAITGKKKSHFLTHETVSLTAEQTNTLQNWLTSLINTHIPLQYLIGSVPFGDLNILVEPPTLIPRPETEEWCLNLIDQLHTLKHQNLTILDLCTGSGCIALALANALPKATVYGTDISSTALALAQKNKMHTKANNVTFLHSDLFQQIAPLFTFDLIVANPPYIAQSEWHTLTPSVTQWEDKNALIAPNNGLAIIEQIIKKAPQYLTNNDELQQKNIAQLIIEIGHQQGAAVHALMTQYQYTQVTITQDMAHKDRIVSGRIISGRIS